MDMTPNTYIPLAGILFMIIDDCLPHFANRAMPRVTRGAGGPRKAEQNGEKGNIHTEEANGDLRWQV
jgi:hypothetical protein